MGGKRHNPYRHPSIQKTINTTLFRDKDDVGVVHHEHFSPMPIPIIALTLTLVMFTFTNFILVDTDYEGIMPIDRVVHQ